MSKWICDWCNHEAKWTCSCRLCSKLSYVDRLRVCLVTRGTSTSSCWLSATSHHNERNGLDTKPETIPEE